MLLKKMKLFVINSAMIIVLALSGISDEGHAEVIEGNITHWVDGAPIDMIIGDGINGVAVSWSINTINKGWFYGGGMFHDTTSVVAHATGVNDIDQLSDASAYSFTHGWIGPICDGYCDSQDPDNSGSFVVWRNCDGFYAVMRIDDIDSPSPHDISNSTLSGKWWFQTDGTPFFNSQQSQPQPVTVTTATSGTKVTISWDTAVGATGYTLFAAPYPGMEYVESLDMANRTSLSATLWEGAAFYVAVQHYNDEGPGPISNIDSFQIPRGEAGMTGEYCVAQYDIDRAMDPWTSLGQFNFHDSGTITAQDNATSDNILSHETKPFSVGSDGSVNIPSTDFAGQVSADGNVLLLADTDSRTHFDDGEIGISVGVKRSSGMSNAKLNGNYLVVQYDIDKPMDPWTALTEFDFYTSGTVIAKDISTSDNNPSTSNALYSVASDGSLTLNGTDLEGQVSADGNVVLFVDTNAKAISDDGEIGLMIGLKTSSGMSNASLSGEYLVAQYDIDLPMVPWTALTVFNFDGKETLTAVDIATSDNAPSGDTRSYSVASNGNVTINDTDFKGQVSADGNILILVDTNSAIHCDDGEIGICVGIRKSQ